MIRLRITFSKTEAMRYTGHLDLQKSWERTLRRATLPVAYSQGFHPQARIQLACALPLGFTSQCELVDIWLEDDLPLQTIAPALNHALPPGIEISQLQIVDPHSPALQTRVQSAEYIVTLLDQLPLSEIEERIKQILVEKKIIRQRREKTYDLRPLIEHLAIIPARDPEPLRLTMNLSARESATGRPEEVLNTLSIDPCSTHIHRVHIKLA
jgi:radical SAM-linked protein